MAHKLLLADDSHTIQRVVELTFASEDIDVVTVGDGAQAIEAIERDEPDIVLADVSMPGKNGYDVASFVRGDSARAGIPVVLLTGAFEPLDQARCDAIGRHDVLVKPFEPREVIGKVRELLALPAAGAADAPAAAAPAEPAAGSSEEAASDETAAGPGAAPSEAPAGDDVEVAAASVLDEVEVAASEAVEAAAQEASAQDETETPAVPAVEEVVAGEEASSTEDETDTDPTAAAVAAVAGEGPAEPSAAGASDPPPPGDEDTATPSERVDPEPETVAAGADGLPESSPEQAAEDEAAARPAGEATPGGSVGAPPAGAGGSVLAQSFVTFLAVEQGAAPPELPAAGAAADSDAEPLLPEAVMDDLVGRVVERLTDTVLRDTVAEVVSRLAERLAHEESARVPPGRE